ncbi:MAG: vWA domain-containing protein [Pirellula sp.]
MPSERLIERGRLAYQALESREEAARYRAAAADLMEAISLAESGDDSKLKVFLDSMDQKTWPNGIPITTQVPTHHTPAQVVQLAPVARIEHSQEKTPADSWSQMLQGAQQRAEKVSTAPQSIAKATIAVHSSPIKANSLKARTNSADKVGKNEITPSKVPSSKSSTGKTSTAKPSTAKPSTGKRKRTKFGLDVWISLGVHGVLLVILGLWVVVTIQHTPVLSVVAATVETNDVLMETPAESISQLDSTSTDSTSITTPDTSELKIEVDPSAISVEKTDLGIAAPSEASSISQQMSKVGAPGNKMVEGAEFFGSKAVGNRFVYIVDASPSMRRDRAFDAAKEEILRSLRSMKPKQRFAILFFGGTLETLELDPGEKIDQPQSATPENIEKAIRWLAKTTIQKEGKPPIDAVKSALDFQPDGIFLLFDGDTKLDNWTQSVRRLNTSDGLLSDGGTKVPIHVIHFFRDEFQRSMQRLAEENAGSYRFVPKSNLRLQP